MDPFGFMAEMGAGSVLSGMNAGPAGPSNASALSGLDNSGWTVATGKASAAGGCSWLPWLIGGGILAAVLLWKR